MLWGSKIKKEGLKWKTEGIGSKGGLVGLTKDLRKESENKYACWK